MSLSRDSLRLWEGRFLITLKMGPEGCASHNSENEAGNPRRVNTCFRKYDRAFGTKRFF